jgi:uncharacterized protein YbjT (DUF2867 family)
MITVTTPNGRVGSNVLRLLLAGGEDVRVVSHNPDKLPQSVRDKCDVVVGSLDDMQMLKRGFDGAETVFWCIPQSSPGNLWDDAHTYHQRFAAAASAALAGSGARVVAISAGRHGYDDHGIVAAFAAVEETLKASGVPIRHLRNAFFMENLRGCVPTIASPGAVFFNGPGDLPLPMVCIADVSMKAVQYLTDRSWHDQGHVAVHGPANVSFDEMAAVLSEVLDKPVRYVQVPDDVLIENLKRVGLPDGFARAYARLLTKEALEAYAIEPRTPETTTPTTLREWATSFLLPAFKSFEARGHNASI